jgi:hypothetical protein
MATEEECRKAVDSLLGRLAELDASEREAKLADRTLSLYVSDLGISYLTKLGPHGADPVTEVHGREPAQIRFTAKSDDVVAISGDLGLFARYWLTRRVKVDASLSDVLSLRNLL